MIEKCDCQSCGQPMEFDADQFERSGDTTHRVLGQSVTCPNCGKSTQLYITRHAPPPPSPAPKPAAPASPQRQQSTAPGAAHRQKSRKKFLPWIIGIGILAIYLLGAFLFQDDHPAELCGVYTGDLGYNLTSTIDLRSDGSARYDLGAASNNALTWTRDKFTHYIDLQAQDGREWTYKIEGNDLIDARGNRYIRLR